MTTALYPGTFDPITFGHLDIIQRASRIFDTVVVAVGINPQKKPLFSADDRVEMIREATPDDPDLEIAQFTGLTVQFAQRRSIHTIVRSLRSTTEFELELATALANRQLEPRIETVYFTPSVEYTYLSSTVVREIAQFGGDLAPFVPQPIAERLRAKYAR